MWSKKLIIQSDTDRSSLRQTSNYMTIQMEETNMQKIQSAVLSEPKFLLTLRGRSDSA